MQCIKVLGGSKRRYAGIGDIIKVSIKGRIPRGKVKKGRCLQRRRCAYAQGRASPRRIADPLRRQRGRAAERKLEPIGTRIFGPVTRELRSERFMKIISLAPEVL